MIASSNVGRGKILGWLRETEQRTGRKILPDTFDTASPTADQEIIEGWSYLAQANATGRIADSALPQPVKSFFRAFKEAIHASLKIAADFIRVRADLDPEFTHWLDVSAGIKKADSPALSSAPETNIGQMADASFAVDKEPGDASPTFDEALINRAVDEAIARGNIASTDKVRPLLPGYTESVPLTRETSFHKQAGELNAEVIKRLLARDPENHLAILLAGGPGSGKTSVIEKLGIPHDLAVDTMLSRETRANLLIDQIRRSDREVIVLYVHREFAPAFDANILRYLESKATGDSRLVPLRAAAEAHVGAQETALTLARQGIRVIVMDNSGLLGTAKREDIGFLENNRYARNHEHREAGPDDDRRDDGNGRPRRGEGLEESAGRSGKQAAIDRLIAEGNAIVERYRREGKLNDAEARAFRGESEGPDGSTDGDGEAPSGESDGGTTYSISPQDIGTPGVPDSGNDTSQAKEESPHPTIRQATNPGTGQELHLFEAPDGTRSEHASLDEALDAWEAWEGKHPARDEGVVELGDTYISERHAKQIKRHERGSKEWMEAVTNSILQPIWRKSSTGGNLPKGRKRKELLGEDLQLTPEERAIINSPHEITVAYKNGRLVNAHPLHQKQYGPSMTGYEAGHTFTHQHPGGNPPSLLDLKDLLGNPGQTLRIVARQEDGSIDLYEMKIEGGLSAEEADYLYKLFKSEVDGMPDTHEQRLFAMGLTVDNSGGKLKFRSRRFAQ